MSSHFVETPPEPSADKRPQALAPLRHVSRRVKLVDKAAGGLIRAAGLGIILVVALIFVFIGAETLPLFRGAEQETISAQPLPDAPPAADVLALGIDEYHTNFYYLDRTRGAIRFVETVMQRPNGNFPLPSLAETRATAAYRTPARDKLAIGTADGRVVFAEAEFEISYGEQAARSVEPSAGEIGVVEVAPDGTAIAHVHTRQNGYGDFIYAAATADGRVFTGKFVEDEPPDEPQRIGGELEGGITSLIVDYEGSRLFIATDARKLYHYYLDADSDAPFHVYDLPAGVTAMDFAIGDVALLLGFEDGAVESWFGVRDDPTDTLKRIRKIHAFEPLPAAVTRIQPSARDKGFVAGGADGTVRLYFTTSERTLITHRLPAAVRQLAYAPKLTALVALAENGELRFTAVDNPHPEVSLKTLFGKVHYEGYDEPGFIWQSSGGTDDFEPKLSLVPLAIGTLKGAFYGLLFAIPVAVFAALYTSQFMAPRLRAWLKPTVEIMAALPSVVIGFLAGLWLAPLLEDVMVGTLLSLVLMPVAIVAGVVGWAFLPRAVRKSVPFGMELVLVIPLAAAGFWLAQELGPIVEAGLFGGNYRQWVFDFFGQQFEQRNSIVIGIAMGFAVIPIIFTISEDAFSNVPPAFKSASYALGASRWQTAWRVIVPTASPGVFSAIMIGFGRAVGETMIVLMATGNTPILSFSPFNGMRTLSANIAVEIPEAPAGGTLYRVLFVAALLLFALTFLCNTIAEVVRQRLREKYQAV